MKLKLFSGFSTVQKLQYETNEPIMTAEISREGVCVCVFAPS